MPLVYLLAGYWLPGAARARAEPAVRAAAARLRSAAVRAAWARALRTARAARADRVSRAGLSVVLCGRAGRICLPPARRVWRRRHRRFWSSRAARGVPLLRTAAVAAHARAARHRSPPAATMRSSIREIESGRAESGQRAVEYVSERPHRGVTGDSARGWERHAACRHRSGRRRASASPPAASSAAITTRPTRLPGPWSRFSRLLWHPPRTDCDPGPLRRSLPWSSAESASRDGRTRSGADSRARSRATAGDRPSAIGVRRSSRRPPVSSSCRPPPSSRAPAPRGSSIATPGR